MENFVRAEIQDVLLQQFAFYVKHNAVAFSSYRARESCIQTNLTKGGKKFFLNHFEQSFVSTTPSLHLRKR